MRSSSGAARWWRQHNIRMASTVGMALAFLAVLADWWPLGAGSSEFHFVQGTVGLLAAGLFTCVAWPATPPVERPVSPRAWTTTAQCVVGAAGLALVAAAAWRAWPVVFAGRLDANQGDMLVLIDQAVARFLSGTNPYGLYQLPWEVMLVYGPGMWLPFTLPHALGFDPRSLTLVAQCVVPAACAWAAVVCVRDTRIIEASALFLLAGVLMLHPAILGFHAFGHTPVYWPLLLIFCWLLRTERWTAAACVAGLLVTARTTMVSLVPVLFLYLFVHRQLTFRRVLALVLGAGVPFLPFLLADPSAVIDGLFTSYLKTMKGYVWTSTSWAQNTFGATGLLLRHGLQAYVEVVQVAALLVVYAAAWRAFRRGARVEPWLALALLVFSMTTLWPVLYVYFDVVVLVAAALAVSVLAAPGARLGLARTFIALVVVTALTVFATAAIRPGAAYTIDVGTPASEGMTGGGFGRDVAVVDGGRTFVWVEGLTARVRLPRAGTSSTTVRIAARAHSRADGAPQVVTASIGGTPIGSATLGPEWTVLTFDAPRRAWYFGFNVLDLAFAYAGSATAPDGTGHQYSVAVDFVQVGG